MKKNKYVKLTKKEIENRFEKYNLLYFEGKVEKPSKFETFTPSKKILGLTRPIFNKKTFKYSAALHISRRYNWTEENLCHVIVHEMIHLLIKDYLQPLKWWEKFFPFMLVQHDKRFKEIMNKLNETYHLNIKIRFPEMKNYFRF